MFHSRISGRAKLWLGASVATLIAVGSAGAAYAADADATPIETVVVTGFKASLERALDMKRNALDSSDTILAEDIAQIPRPQPLGIDPAHSRRRAGRATKAKAAKSRCAA